MKLRTFLRQFEKYSEEMLDKDIQVECPNGVLVEPVVKRNLKDKTDRLNHSTSNVESLVITYF